MTDTASPAEPLDAARPVDPREATLLLESAGDLRRSSFDAEYPVDRWDPVAAVLHRFGWNWRHVFAFSLIFFGPIEKLLIPWLQGYLTLGGPLSEWRPDLEALLVGFIEWPILIAFYAWSAEGVTRLFIGLERNRSVESSKAYRGFLREAMESFSRPWWSVLAGILAVGITLAAHLFLWTPPYDPVKPWFLDGEPLSRIIALFGVLVGAYAGVQLVLREFLVVRWLWRLWRLPTLRLRVHPGHPDGAGGLGVIAQHALYLSVIAFVFLMTLAGAVYLPALRGQPNPELRGWVVAVVAAYLLLVPGLFFALIWPAHRRMLRYREDRLGVLFDRIDRLFDDAEKSASGPRAGDFKEIVERLDRYRGLYAALNADLPRWPLPTSIRRQLRLSALIPAAYSLITLLIDIGVLDWS